MTTELHSEPAFPEGFKTFLEDHALPCPPMETEAIAELDLVTTTFYATHLLPEPKRILYVADAKAFFDTVDSYVGFGLVGYGLQNQEVIYLVKRSHLQLAISLPWSRAYHDPEEESTILQTALHLAEACQHHASGEHLADDDLLTLILTPNNCHWSWTSSTTSLEGSDISSLFHLLENTLNAQEITDPHCWISV